MRIDEGRRKKTARKLGCFLNMVPTSRLELERPRVTTPSRWRVYQFHHVGSKKTYCVGVLLEAGACCVAGVLCCTVLKSKPCLVELL